MRVVGLELAGDVLRSAVVEHRLGRRRLVGVAQWPTSDGARTAALLRHASAVRLGVPAQLTTHRWLTLPFRRVGQLAATAPLELLAQLPHEPADVTVGWCRTGRDASGSTVLAAATRGATLDALLATPGLPDSVETWFGPLAAWSLVPANAGDLVLLIADGTRSNLSVRRNGRVVALRGLDAVPTRDDSAFADEVCRTLAVLAPDGGAIAVGGADASATLAATLRARTAATVTSLEALAPATAAASCVVAAGLAMAGAAERLCFDDARDVAPARIPRRVAGLAAAAALAAVVDLGLYRHRLVAEDAALQEAIAVEAASALPGVALVAPRAQLEAALHQTAGGDVRFDTPVLDTLREASTRLPSDIRLEVDELVVDGARFRLHGRTDSYEHVDALRRALAGARTLTDVRADDTHTGVDGATVEFTLQATRRAAEGTSS